MRSHFLPPNLTESPSTHIPEISRRLDSVEYLLNHPDLINQIRSRLSQCADLERMVQKLHLGSAGPVDLVSMHNTLLEIQALQRELATYARLHKIANKKCLDSRSENIARDIISQLSFSSKILSVCQGLISEDAINSTKIVASGVIGKKEPT